ncbi:unnamed protein product [Calicophoron daubneyi]|uniref:Uncharacterized protein n=1 Tax=Calicophoron daubneyi TaxID=300641 RepID=A0AAV2TTM8_CALDB
MNGYGIQYGPYWNGCPLLPQGWARRSNSLGKSEGHSSKLMCSQPARLTGPLYHSSSDTAAEVVDRVIAAVKDRHSKGTHQLEIASTQPCYSQPRNPWRSYSRNEKGPRNNIIKFSEQKSRVQKIIDEFLSTAQRRGLYTRRRSENISTREGNVQRRDDIRDIQGAHSGALSALVSNNLETELDKIFTQPLRDTYEGTIPIAADRSKNLLFPHNRYEEITSRKDVISKREPSPDIFTMDVQPAVEPEFSLMSDTYQPREEFSAFSRSRSSLSPSGCPVIEDHLQNQYAVAQSQRLKTPITSPYMLSQIHRRFAQPTYRPISPERSFESAHIPNSCYGEGNPKIRRNFSSDEHQPADYLSGGANRFRIEETSAWPKELYRTSQQEPITTGLVEYHREYPSGLSKVNRWLPESGMRSKRSKYLCDLQQTFGAHDWQHTLPPGSHCACCRFNHGLLSTSPPWIRWPVHSSRKRREPYVDYESINRKNMNPVMGRESHLKPEFANYRDFSDPLLETDHSKRYSETGHRLNRQGSEGLHSPTTMGSELEGDFPAALSPIQPYQIFTGPTSSSKQHVTDKQCSDEKPSLPTDDLVEVKKKEHNSAESPTQLKYPSTANKDMLNAQYVDNCSATPTESIRTQVASTPPEPRGLTHPLKQTGNYKIARYGVRLKFLATSTPCLSQPTSKHSSQNFNLCDYGRQPYGGDNVACDDVKVSVANTVPKGITLTPSERFVREE